MEGPHDARVGVGPGAPATRSDSRARVSLSDSPSPAGRDPGPHRGEGRAGRRVRTDSLARSLARDSPAWVHARTGGWLGQWGVPARPSPSPRTLLISPARGWCRSAPWSWTTVLGREESRKAPAHYPPEGLPEPTARRVGALGTHAPEPKTALGDPARASAERGGGRRVRARGGGGPRVQPTPPSDLPRPDRVPITVEPVSSPQCAPVRQPSRSLYQCFGLQFSIPNNRRPLEPRTLAHRLIPHLVSAVTPNP